VRVYQTSSSESSSEEEDRNNSIRIQKKCRKWSPIRMLETADMGNRGCECDQCAQLGVMEKQTRYREYDDVDLNGDPPNRNHFFSLADHAVGGISLKERAFGKGF
jgi:hypothetical protein